MYDPQKDLINLKGKLYLQTVYRVKWFHSQYPIPRGKIDTDLVREGETIVMKASIYVDGSLIATGYGTAKTGTKAVWAGREYEKAETAAIGRALAHAGFGTEFSLDEDSDDSDHLADSPVALPQPEESRKPAHPFPTGRSAIIQQVEAYLDQHGMTMQQALAALKIKSPDGLPPNFDAARRLIDQRLLDKPSFQ